MLSLLLTALQQTEVIFLCNNHDVFIGELLSPVDIDTVESRFYVNTVDTLYCNTYSQVFCHALFVNSETHYHDKHTTACEP